MSDQAQKLMAQEDIEEANGPRVGEVYRHWKSGIYDVIALLRVGSTGDELAGDGGWRAAVREDGGGWI